MSKWIVIVCRWCICIIIIRNVCVYLKLVWVCVCVCVCACMWGHICVCVCTCVWIGVCVCVLVVCVDVCTVCVCVYVLVSEDVCLGGTYSGHEPMGLLWSLRPVPGSRPSLRFTSCTLCRVSIQTVFIFTMDLLYMSTMACTIPSGSGRRTLGRPCWWPSPCTRASWATPSQRGCL